MSWASSTWILFILLVYLANESQFLSVTFWLALFGVVPVASATVIIILVYCITNLLFFDIPLLYFYIKLRLSRIFCLNSGDIYLALGISLSYPFVTISELLCGEFF